MLSVAGVTKAYATDAAVVHALRGIDLSIGEGELVAVVGPSGCGKSTLLHIMGALDVPTSGTVRLRGRSLGDLDDRERTLVRRDEVGFVFQFFNLVPVLTVAENVALPAVVARRPSREREARLGEVLDAVGLDALGPRLPSELSGGQQQRVAIARALFNSPAVVLADEPTGNLDHASGQEIVELFARLNSGGQTVVIVTHDPSVAAATRRIVTMHDGRVAADEPRR